MSEENDFDLVKPPDPQCTVNVGAYFRWPTGAFTAKHGESFGVAKTIKDLHKAIDRLTYDAGLFLENREVWHREQAVPVNGSDGSQYIEVRVGELENILDDLKAARTAVKRVVGTDGDLARRLGRRINSITTLLTEIRGDE